MLFHHFLTHEVHNELCIKLFVCEVKNIVTFASLRKYFKINEVNGMCLLQKNSIN